MNTLVQDVRYGLRMLARAPVVSTVAALSLGLGIAANASIFALIDGFLLEPLPFRDQDRLVVFREGPRGAPQDMLGGTSVGNFRDYEAGIPSVTGAMLYTVDAANLTGMDVPEQVTLVRGTPNFFDVLGVQPALGRGFRPEEGVEGAGRVVILHHAYWERRFLGDPDVLGRTVTLDGAPHTVIGVMPEDFDIVPATVQAFTPSDFEAQREVHGSGGYLAFARLAPGASLDQLRREVDRVWTRLEGEHPEATRGAEVRVMPMRQFFPSETDRKLFTILAAVTLFGLLIACANVANLLLSRADERQKEVAVRTALGAGRARILRQLLTESVTLGVLAGLLGIGLSLGIVRWIQSAMPAELPRAMMPRLDLGVLLATVAVSMAAGIVFGLAPALQAVRVDLRDALGEGSRGGTAGRTRRRVRNAFVVGEFAVALALLTGAGFLTETFNQVTGADPGFRQEGLLTFSLTIPTSRYAERADLHVYQDELLEALADVPGVRGVAAMSTLPRGMASSSRAYTVVGDEREQGAEEPTASFQTVSPDYFSTMEIPLRRGRLVESTDREDGQAVVVVSEAFVHREFPGGDALGRSVRISGEDEPRVVVGVVADVLQQRIPLAGDLGEALYVPLAQSSRRNVSFALRVAGDPTSVADEVRTAVWSVNPDQPVAGVRTLDAFVEESLAGPRAISVFLVGMGLIALLLAAMGIYGVMAHAVTQKRREIGIRMALGAGRSRVVGMVTRNGLTLVGAGMLLGLPLAYLMYQATAGAINLFDTAPGLTWAAAVTVALTAVAAFSAWLPAHRASGVQPGTALRE